MNIKQLYNDFLVSGELFVFLPNAKGQWEKDAKEFKRIYNRIISALTNLNNESNEEDDEDDMSTFGNTNLFI
jgi:uncharacterized protein YukE